MLKRFVVCLALAFFAISASPVLASTADVAVPVKAEGKAKVKKEKKAKKEKAPKAEKAAKKKPAKKAKKAKKAEGEE